MTTLNIEAMRNYLSRSIASLNRNKLNGLLAEIDFREHLKKYGCGHRVSVGGWIVRSEGMSNFGHKAIVFFPETISSRQSYSAKRESSQPPDGLHTICTAFHQIGIQAYFLSPIVETENEPESVRWQARQLGLPTGQEWAEFPTVIDGFRTRTRRYNFLRYHTDCSLIPDNYIEEEFSKENARISFNSRLFCEIADVDGVLWGQQYTYPIEIKEKTVANCEKVGDYFGLDLGPFVKLTFYTARSSNLHSLFIVREIDNIIDRKLVNWWYIKFDDLAKYASWNPIGGGRNMQGGGSTTVKIPKEQFKILDEAALASL